jgi:ATP synthase protein I
MSESEPPDRLARLRERLQRAQPSRGDRLSRAGSDQPVAQHALGTGLRIGIELVVAVVVAVGLGWAIDRWLGTHPWGMIVMFFLGVAAGMLSVYRAIAGINTAVGLRRLEPRDSGQEPAKGPPVAKDQGSNG